MMLYAVIIIMFMFYLFIPVYAHKVSRGDDLITYSSKIIKISTISQAMFILYSIWVGGAIAHQKHLELQYLISVLLIIVVGLFANVIMITYVTDRYLPKIQLNLSVYNRLTVHEYIWIMAILVFIYYVCLWFFYNHFNPYTM